MKEAFGIVSSEDATAALIDIASGVDSERVWNVINGIDYQDKFPLLLAIIGEAESYRAFGTKYVSEDEMWKWTSKKQLAEASYFEKLRDGMLELASKAYITRGEWKIIISKILEDAKACSPRHASRSKVS
jgi:hypothetical protein